MFFKKSKFTCFSKGKKRAENGTRTRDPNLGKVVLYQLSYFRKKCEEEETRTPTSQLTLPPQSSASTNSATSPTLKLWIKKECPEQDSNLHASRHTHLKRARLPIPPPGLLIAKTYPNALFCSINERKTGLGPATPTLARLCSTN